MTRIRTLGLSALLVTASVALTSHAAELSSGSQVGARFENGIVAIVENRIITVGDIRREIEPILPTIASDARTPEEFRRALEQAEDAVIQRLVDDYLIVKDFYSDEKRRLPSSVVDNEYQERLMTMFDGDRSKLLAFLKAIGKTRLEWRNMLTEEIIVSYMKSEKQRERSMVSPVKIENYYMQNRDKFFQGDSMHLRMILLKKVTDENSSVLEQTAETIMRRLREGADFAALAKEFSQHSSRERGGDMDWLARNDLREELAGVAFSLDKGAYSEPIRLDDQIFILKLEDKRLAGIQPLSAVREQIEGLLANQATSATHERWLERLRRNAYVRYFN